jgi:chromate reductase
MEKHLNLLSICGSLRQGSYNAALERALPGLMPPHASVQHGPWLGDFPLYNMDVQQDDGFPEPVKRLGDLVRHADGVIFVTPEYNYSVPGVLKNAIDWVSRLPDQPFRRKPVLIQSASTSLLGGVRAQYHLRQIMVFVEALPFNRPEVMVAQAQNKIDEATGELTDEPTRDLVRTQLAAFAEFVREHGKATAEA